MIRYIVVASLASVLFAGCGGGPGSCSQAQSGTMACVEYTGSSSVTPEVVQQYCTQAMGTYSGGGCTPANRVGRCTYPTGPLTSIFNFYAPLTTAQAEMACARFPGSTFAAN